MSRSARRGSPAKRRLLEFWWDIQKRRRLARSKRVMKGTRVYFESLESRLLLSGGVEGVSIDTDLISYQALAQAPVAAELASLEEAEKTALIDLSGLAELDPEMQPELMDGAGTGELVFVDENVDDYEQLFGDLQQADNNRIIEVVVLESDWNGIEQVTQVLWERSNLAAVHFITHGADGQIDLGNTWLNSATLQENIDAISAWGNALTETGDILFYGCSIAAGSDGQSLLKTMADLTGADVAASDDPTGHLSLGGDWQLEYTSGPIEAGVAFSMDAQQNWGHLLNVAVDASSTGSTADQASVTVSHTTSGSNRLMLVSMATDPHGVSVSSISYNGVNLMLVGAQEDPSAHSRVEIWELVAPDTGTHDVIVNLTGTSHRGVTVGVITFTGVNQTTPTTAFSSASGTSTAASTTVASQTDDLVFAVLHSYNGSAATPGAGQTELWDVVVGQTNGSGTTKAGAASITSSWTVNDNDWSVAAVSVQADTNSAVAAAQSPVQDAYIQSKNPSTNNGTSGSMVINRETGNLQRALVQFDMSSIPAGSTIMRATLKLQATSIDGLLTIDAYQVLQAWAEGSTTWNESSSGINWSTAGGDFNATALDSITTAATGQHTWDITALVQDWVDGAAQNYGVLVGCPGGGGNRTATYDTREGTVAPVLEIIYTTSNTAPTLDSTKSPALTAIAEDAGAPSGALGTLVSSLVDFAVPAGQVDNVTDPDSGALLGIAITAADMANGTWYYSTNNGTNWNALGAVANNNARLLAADANTRIYFQPNANYNGTLLSAITFRAWDQTRRSNGALADTSTNGGTTAFSTATDTASLVINAVNDAPVGVPIITGTATEDQTLTADVSGISDADGLGSFSYQWLRNGANIAGATGSTYTLGDADVGDQISVQVSYTDGQGTNESLTSAQTTAVANVAVTNVNDAPTGSVTITGTPTEDQTLTADVSGISDADGLGPLSYQEWLRNDANIAGGSGSTNTLLPKHTDASLNELDKVSEQEEIPKEEAPKEDVPKEFNPAPNQPFEKRDVLSSPPIRTDFLSLLFSRESLRNTITARDERSNAVQEKDLRPEGPLSVMRVLDYEYLRNSLDAVKQEMTSEIKLGKMYLGSAIVSSIGLSVGYIVWLLRGGMLFASLLSSIPAWQFLDPLPILARKKDDDQSDDNESLESIVDQKTPVNKNEKKTADASSDAEVKR